MCAEVDLQCMALGGQRREMRSRLCVKNHFTCLQGHDKPFPTAQDPQVKPRTPNKPLPQEVLAEQSGGTDVAGGLPAVISEGKRHSPQRQAISRRVPALLAPPQVGFLPPGRLEEGWRPLGIPMFAAWPQAGGWSGLSL